jgi:predicted nucleotidyltransferase
MSSEVKFRVAREAATLLFFGAEKEYKQAKTKAAETLGTHFLPSNLEVALELDKIVEENEGSKRKERLIEMRKEALAIMKLISAYCPLLIGSVWRGTIRRGSDIDIETYADDPQKVLDALKTQHVKISRTAWTTVNKHGATLASYHIFAETPGKNALEIVVRASDENGKRRKCEIFGDEIKGLKLQELEKLLQDNPSQKFITE